jgi:hypothetical protein
MLRTEWKPLKDFHPPRPGGYLKTAPLSEKGKRAEESQHQDHSRELLNEIHSNP